MNASPIAGSAATLSFLFFSFTKKESASSRALSAAAPPAPVDFFFPLDCGDFGAAFAGGSEARSRLSAVAYRQLAVAQPPPQDDRSP